ncbi:hypothetical protein GC197_00455 [bacterium]|nr:hypothetical protein [bacterium]
MTVIPTIQDSFPPASADEITEFERRFDLKIPPPYRRFLMTTNGGRFAADAYFGPIKAELGVNLFYSLNAVFDYLDLSNVRKAYLGEIPHSFLVIADDGLGNPICIDTKNLAGPVFEMNHEGGSRALVCDQFEQFLAGIHYSDDPDLVLWSETVEPFISIEQGDFDAVSRISLDQFDLMNEYGYSPLGCAAASGQPSVMKMLLSRGANIEVGADDGRTPLMLASAVGAFDVTCILLEHGADLEATDGVGRTALLHALAARQTRVARHLVESGANVNIEDKYGYTPRKLSQDGSASKYVLPLL